MEGAEIARLIEELETRVERLRALYDQYFVGIERLEPLVLRKDVDRRLWMLRREQIRNTALRFKLETTVQRYNTYQQYWQRIVREIENGTYQRDLGRAMRRFGDVGTALGKRRQKMFEKGMARRAERDARAGRSSAPPSGSQAPPGPSDQPEAASISNGPPRVPSPPPPSAEAAPSEEWEDVDLELELQSSRPPPPLEVTTPAKVGAIPAASPPPRIALTASAQIPPSAASSPVAPRGPVVPAPPRAGTAPPIAKIVTPAPAKAVTAPAAKSPAAAPQAPATASPLATKPQAPAAAPTKPQGPAAVPAAAKPQAPAAAAARAQVPAAAKLQAARPPATATPAASPAKPAGAAEDLSAARIRQIYGQYVEAKRRANESTAALTYEKVAANLQQTAQALRAKHGSQTVDFEVVLKNGKPAIKPILKG